MSSNSNQNRLCFISEFYYDMYEEDYKHEAENEQIISDSDLIFLFTSSS